MACALWPTIGLTVGAGLQIRITFKNQELLRGVTWDVKRGERVGLVGENIQMHELCQPRSSSLPPRLMLLYQNSLCYITDVHVTRA